MSLYCWGANSHGQLGLGYVSEMVMEPVEIQQEQIPFIPIELKMVKGGGGHAVALDIFGHVFVCGWNNKGQLGLKNNTDTSTFKKIECDAFDVNRVINVACGWDFSLAINCAGHLYMWGSNICTQLFTSKEITGKYVTSPRRIAVPCCQKVMNAGCGQDFTVILNSDNYIYVVGNLKPFRELLDSQPELLYSHQGLKYIYMTFPEKITHISVGQKHFLISLDLHIIKGFGSNKFGQITVPDPSIVEPEILKLHSGWTHNGLLTKFLQLFTWGRNCYGQLGIAEEKSIVREPQLIALNLQNDKITQFHLGSEHGLLLTQKGKMYSWGWNEHGSCGNGTVDNQFTPVEVRIKDTKFIKAGIGDAFCFVLARVMTNQELFDDTGPTEEEAVEQEPPPVVGRC